MLLMHLLIVSGFGDFHMEIFEKTNSTLNMYLSFYEERTEPKIIGFIISPEPPICDYSLIECDTLKFKKEISYLSPVNIGAPFGLGTYRLYPIIINPLFENKYKKIQIKSLKLKINFSEYNSVEIPLSLAQVYRNLILNYQYNEETKPRGLLIITPNSFYNTVLPLADWKEKKGW
uniref:Gingipain propeptide domain-containing protein n=1 Tax=candidate division WOR-3 bacterium TaxID=2052148 RepID=A0A7C4TD24_UNCW3